MEEICFEELVRSAVERMQMEARNRKQTLECYSLGDIPNIEADYGRIEQVVFNILSNAIKYTPEGGSIRGTVKFSHEKVILEINDTGIGISREHWEAIFERFYRVDKARSRESGGQGLGLSIAKWIVERHRGIISVNSEPGVGSTFTITLPEA
jgi:signal transduction histidine kinase